MRLDKFLQEKFDLRSRTYAENLILKGQVLLNGKVMRKPSFDVDVDAENDVRIENDLNFASQGAYKLLEALTVFGISVNGSTCVDIGCSNGGFTDCLLRSGAKRNGEVSSDRNATAYYTRVRQNPDISR